jgi:hypothetical protein
MQKLASKIGLNRIKGLKNKWINFVDRKETQQRSLQRDDNEASASKSNIHKGGRS